MSAENKKIAEKVAQDVGAIYEIGPIVQALDAAEKQGFERGARIDGEHNAHVRDSSGRVKSLDNLTAWEMAEEAVPFYGLICEKWPVVDVVSRLMNRFSSDIRASSLKEGAEWMREKAANVSNSEAEASSSNYEADTARRIGRAIRSLPTDKESECNCDGHQKSRL